MVASINTGLGLNGKGVIYMRVSTDQQDADRQRDSISRWLNRHSLKVKDENTYKDEGWKRWEADRRPAFQRLLSDADAGAVKWIVVDRQDRFEATDKWEMAGNINRLRRAGCRLFTVDDREITAGDILSFFTTGMDSERSEAELKEKSIRVLEGKLRKAKEGQYLGGPIPYGMDAVCLDLQAKELWRVQIEGHNLRVQITPDGRTRRYDGEQNFPQRSGNEVMKLRPSTRKGCVEAIKTIFDKFLNEAIDYNNIAKFLNTQGTPYSYREGWEYHHVRSILRNPIYTGCAAYNRRSGGRFHEFVNGERREVLGDRNPNSSRARQQSDWVWTDEQFKPIIPHSTWEQAQEKIGAIVEYKRRAPKSSDLWLAGLCYCSGCGAKMRGFKGSKPGPRHKNPKPGYVCSTYAKHSASDDCKCQRNSVAHEVVEKYIRQFLEETSGVIDAVLPADNNRALNGNYWDKYKGKLFAAVGAYNRMLDRAAEANPDVHPAWAVDDNPAEVMKLYRILHAEDQQPLRNKLKELETEHDRLTDGLLNLPKDAGRAIGKAQARMKELEAEIAKAEEGLSDASGQFEDAQAECTRITDEWNTALSTVTSEASDRRKAEAVRKIIGRINLTFEPTGKKHPTSELTAVEIVPLGGEAQKYPTRGTDIRFSKRRG